MLSLPQIPSLVVWIRCHTHQLTVPGEVSNLKVATSGLYTLIFTSRCDGIPKCGCLFSCLRYTKALDVLKKLHKEQAQLIKEMKLKLEHLRTLKDSAHRVRQNT